MNSRFTRLLFTSLVTCSALGPTTGLAATTPSYVVRPGDTLYKISVAKHVSLTNLESANPQVVNFANLQVGTTLHLPRAIRPTTDPNASALLTIAKSYIGVPYVWGSNKPAVGFDCSGFVQYVFGRAHIHLPRQSHQQASVGNPVPRNRLQPGDLLFFSNTDQYARDYTNHVTHVGIYMGHGNMIESSSTHHDEGVVVIPHVFANAFYRSHFFGARRILG